MCKMAAIVSSETPTSNLNKRAIIWNSAGSIVSALQSFVFLIAVTRILGVDAAGDYSIGAAIAQLMWVIGIFEQASYLTTDANNRFSFEQYFAFKILSCIAMAICSLVYVWSFGFALEKAILALWLCAFKLVDAFAGYFHAVFQKCNRLDISGQVLFIENLTAIIVFVPALIFGLNLISAAALSTIIMAVVTMGAYIYAQRGVVEIGAPDFSYSKLIEQFWQLFPLFVACFLYGYLANTPRYAIEEVGTSAMQTYFNTMFMPAFVISLCVRFFLKPAVTSLSDYWAEGKLASFTSMVIKLLLGVCGVTALVLLGSFLVGIPLLNLVFNINLDGYLGVLLLLMLASGVMVASDVLYYPIVIFRQQFGVVLAYGLAMVAGIIVANKLVITYDLYGAALVYLLEAAIVLAVFTVLTVLAIQRKKRSLS